MNRYKFTTQHKRLLADTLTPVNIYLKLRDRFPRTLLLESSDYAGNDNTFSYICFDPWASFELRGKEVRVSYPDGQSSFEELEKAPQGLDRFQEFVKCFEVEPQRFNFPQNGLFGYSSYDAVRYFEDIEISTYEEERREIPDLLYQAYRFVIAINHFNNELYIFEHLYGEVDSQLEEVASLIQSKNFPAYHFQLEGEEESNLVDEEYLEYVKQGIRHCERGDVFQIVLSRQFSQRFSGDEFNVYRALRSINPSPYLFYFDFGNFKIFGSSPEAQIVVKNERAEIHPIAGTFKRTGNDKEDSKLARELFDDEKENAEHVMLVDLARNDLSRNGSEVEVETYKEIQFYSHLIHLVSKVVAKIDPDQSSLRLFADTFPAGTLSGAPKYRAMELINKIENQNRGFYGGAIGFISFKGDINQAIMIRSFLSKNNQLYYQAGAGIVSKSQPENEREEVINKLGALRKALQDAEDI